MFIFFNGVFEIAWSSDGDAKFHDICWKAVLDSLRMDNPFCFSSLEKNVVEEGKRTAEYFDSAEKLDTEAGRIAEMLQSAAYAIAFTGMYLFYLFHFCKIHLMIINGTFKNVKDFQKAYKAHESWAVIGGRVFYFLFNNLKTA